MNNNVDAPNTYTLGITTCDKCGKIMLPGDKVIFIGNGTIGNFTENEEFLKLNTESIRYACHLDCWDHYEDGYEGIEDIKEII